MGAALLPGKYFADALALCCLASSAEAVTPTAVGKVYSIKS